MKYAVDEAGSQPTSVRAADPCAAPADRQIAPGRRIVADEERGNKLHNADTYFSVYYTKFKAAGHSRTWTTQGLKSKEWYCPKGNKRCYFPGQK
ncbi:hypothetical protein ACX8Z9_14105 [Arthrobacter halodurans]